MSNNLDRLAQLSKQQEMELYSDLIAKCPAGYVRDILTDMRLDVERAIRSDFGFVPFGVYMQQANEQKAEIEQTARKLSELRATIHNMEVRKNQLEQELDKVRAIASKLQWLGSL